MTRGVRIDRVYLNFAIDGATMEVSTLHHPGSDHKGVLYKIRECSGPTKVDAPKALPHRAFDLSEAEHLLGSMVQQVPCGTGGHGFISHG